MAPPFDVLGQINTVVGKRFADTPQHGKRVPLVVYGIECGDQMIRTRLITVLEITDIKDLKTCIVVP